MLESSFDRYEPVRGPAPARPRTDDNPLNREEYIRRVTRRGAEQLQALVKRLDDNPRSWIKLDN